MGAPERPQFDASTIAESAGDRDSRLLITDAMREAGAAVIRRWIDIIPSDDLATEVFEAMFRQARLGECPRQRL